MLIRCVAACGLVLLATTTVVAQARPTQPAAPNCLDQPTQYPPLLRPPVDPNPPLAVVPRGPSGEYDHNLLYLPDYVPPSAPEACRPLGRWWIGPTFEFAWLPSKPATNDLRLRVPTPSGSIPGPILPLTGLSAERFQGGFGLTGGWWFNRDNTRGVDASMFFIGGGESTFWGFAPAMLMLFPNGSARSAPQVIVFPPDTPIVGVFPATLATWFIGADVNYRHNLHCGPNARLDLLAGYRFAFLQDELFIGESPDGSHDEFLRNRVAVSNRFHGGQIGLASEYRGEGWYVSGTAKVALGVVTPEVCTTGLFVGAEGSDVAGGFTRLAALGNSGGSQFAVLPTVGLQLGKQVRDHARLFVGYTFQYLNRVARLSDVANPANASLALTDFWIQSFNLGFELRY